MNELGKYLKKLRGKRSLRQAAKEIGISHTYLDSLEKGYDPRTKKERKPTPEVLRKISNYYDVPYVVLMTKAGYVNEDGAVPVDSFYDLMIAPPSEVEKAKEEGALLGYGTGGYSYSKVGESKNEEKIDLYKLLKSKSDLYYKENILTSSEKDKINKMIQTLLD